MIFDLERPVPRRKRKPQKPRGNPRARHPPSGNRSGRPPGWTKEVAEEKLEAVLDLLDLGYTMPEIARACEPRVSEQSLYCLLGRAIRRLVRTIAQANDVDDRAAIRRAADLDRRRSWVQWGTRWTLARMYQAMLGRKGPPWEVE